MFCADCSNKVSGIAVNDSTRYALQYIVSSTIEKLFSFKVSDEVLQELCRISGDYTAYYVHHTFKSLQIITEGFTP
jgi:DNA repair protein RecO (recombination protein O)